jgi:hypothetical protein
MTGMSLPDRHQSPSGSTAAMMKSAIPLRRSQTQLRAPPVRPAPRPGPFQRAPAGRGAAGRPRGSPRGCRQRRQATGRVPAARAGRAALPAQRWTKSSCAVRSTTRSGACSPGGRAGCVLPTSSRTSGTLPTPGLTSPSGVRPALSTASRRRAASTGPAPPRPERWPAHPAGAAPCGPLPSTSQPRASQNRARGR